MIANPGTDDRHPGDETRIANAIAQQKPDAAVTQVELTCSKAQEDGEQVRGGGC